MTVTGSAGDAVLVDVDWARVPQHVSVPPMTDDIQDGRSAVEHLEEAGRYLRAPLVEEFAAGGTHIGAPVAAPVGASAGFRPAVRGWFVLAPLAALAVAIGATVLAPASERGFLITATAIAAAAGLSATSIGVFGGVLVPGLLLLGVEPRVAAPLSLLLQVLVIPVGAASHYAVGNVQRRITIPLIAGGVAGSVTGALLASTVPAALVARVVALVIIVVGAIVLATIRTGYAAGRVEHEEVHQGWIGGIGLVAGLASGISGAGWGPIGVKLLILARIEPCHAIGSSLVGRVAMAVSAVVAYAAGAAATGAFRLDPFLVVALLAGAFGTILPGTLLIARIGRGRAAVMVAALSIGLALPTLILGGR